MWRRRLRPQVSRPRAFLALALVAGLLAPHAPAAAQAEPVIRWSYTVSVPEPESGNVRVRLEIDGAKDIVASFTFSTHAPRAEAGNVTGLPGTPLEVGDGTVRFDVDGREGFTYDVAVVQPAFREGERLQHVGRDFALFKMESVQLEFRYSFFAGKTWRNETTVTFDAPAGWSAAGAWPRATDGAYVVPGGEVLPRGYVAMGPFLEDRTFDAAGKRFRYVRMGEPGEFEPRLETFLANATPFYEAVYGPGVGTDLLVVNAPDPMYNGGLGGVDSLFLHQDVDVRILAHEYAHVFQLFATEESPPSTTLWVNEGDADYHSAFALYATGEWTAGEVNRFFEDARDDETKSETQGRALVEATYGSTLEKFAYHKGAIVLHALDAAMREASAGRAGVSDLLRELNRLHGPRDAALAGESVTNAEVAGLASHVAGADLSDFFARYVNGTDWPARAEFVPEGRLAVERLDLDAQRAPPGANVTARATLVNRGTASLDDVVELRVDGTVADEARVTLDIGESKNVTLRFVAPAPGDHDVSVLGDVTTFHSLLPADLRLRTVSIPALRAGVEAHVFLTVENVGEQGAPFRVLVAHENATLATRDEADLEASATREVALPLRIDDVGERELRFALESAAGNHSVTRVVAVAEAPATPPPPPGETPGVRVDASPPGTTPTPHPAWAALAAAAVVAALTARRRPR